MTPEVQAIQEALAKWIDPDVIAETILDALNEEEMELTEENGQKVWDDVLYTELGEAVARSVNALADKGEIHLRG